MEKRTKRYISVLLNVVVVLLEIVAFYNARNLGWWQFRYYTQLSNLLAGIACLLLTAFLLFPQKVPTWVLFLKFCATVMLTQTFLISSTVLSIFEGGIRSLMFGPIFGYFHTLCPILTIVSFLFFDPSIERFELRHSLLAMIPTLLYGIVAVSMNILKVWHGPYPFLYVYEQPVWLSVTWVLLIFGATFLFAYFLRVIEQRLKQEHVY